MKPTAYCNQHQQKRQQEGDVVVVLLTPLVTSATGSTFSGKIFSLKFSDKLLSTISTRRAFSRYSQATNHV